MCFRTCRTGLGDDTSVVPVIHEGDDAKLGIGAAREEFAACCFPCVEEVLRKTGIKAKEIDFVVTNSSLFNPTPSLSTTVMNHFNMGKRTKGYSLGGMGCRCVGGEAGGELCFMSCCKSWAKGQFLFAEGLQSRSAASVPCPLLPCISSL